MTWRACKRATPSVEYGWIHPLYPGAVNELPEKLRGANPEQDRGYLRLST